MMILHMLKGNTLKKKVHVNLVHKRPNFVIVMQTL